VIAFVFSFCSFVYFSIEMVKSFRSPLLARDLVILREQRKKALAAKAIEKAARR
jgi:hypothetical protein